MSRIKIVVYSALLFPLFTPSAHAGFYDWIKEAKASQNRFLGAHVLEASNSWSLSKVYNQSEINGPVTDPEEPLIAITEEISGFSAVKTMTVRATGYSSTPDQTDASPFITASGSRVRDGIIAANFQVNGRRVPFGTKIRIPELYGNKIFVVEDRMNARYTNNIDIWFPDRGLAQRFGSHSVKIEIIPDEDLTS